MGIGSIANNLINNQIVDTLSLKSPNKGPGLVRFCNQHTNQVDLKGQNQDTYNQLQLNQYDSPIKITDQVNKSNGLAQSKII